MAFTEKYVTNSGAGAADGSSLANAWSWATMLTSLSAGQRANVQGAITRTTSADVFTNAGTAANPMAIRGINLTLDDLEANGRTPGGELVTTNFPVITYTTGRLTLSAFMVCEHISFTGAPSTQTLSVGTSVVRRCLVANTIASGTNSAASLGNGGVAIDCDFTNSSSSANGRCLTLGSASYIESCLIYGSGSFGGVGANFGSTGSFLSKCMIRDVVTGVAGSGGVGSISSCSFRGISGVHLALPGSLRAATNCVAWGTGGSSQWYATGGTVLLNNQLNNFVGNMGVADADEGNWPTRYETTLTADPFVSSTDLTLNNTSGGGALVRAAGYPAYLDGGAWQHQDAASGGMIGGGNLSGGFQ
jgi:hypothetical protein